MRAVGFVALILLLSGCANTDPTPTFMDMDYQVRCRGMCNNSVDDPARSVVNLDGEDGYVVECLVTGSGSSREVTASVECNSADDACGGEYAFKLLTARLGDDVGSECLVVISEGSNTYEGKCTAGEPSEDTPCKLDISEDDGAIVGSVRCIDIANVNAPTELRSVSEPGTDQPAAFSILNCE